MRKKVRGLRKIEQAVLKRQSVGESKPHAPGDSEAATPVNVGPMDDACVAADADSADARGARLLRGGAWHSQRRSRGPAPPSRLADGRGVGRSPRVDPAERGRAKRGFAEQQLSRLAGCIDRGLDAVRDEQETIRKHVKDIKEVAATLEPGGGPAHERQETFEGLIDRFSQAEDPIHRQMVQVMTSFLAGLFVGEGTLGTDPRQSRSGALVSLTQESRTADPRPSPRRDSDRPGRAHAWCMPSMPTPRIPSRSPWTTCCRIGQLGSRSASNRHWTAARS